MKPEDSPFKTGWWMAGLEGYRPCDATYCLFDYANLPPLSPPDDAFGWLHLDEPLQQRMVPYQPDYASLIGALAEATLTEAGITLPADFTSLMRQPERLRLVPSCTAGYFDVLTPIPSPRNDGAWLLPFFRDQQDVVVWSLYLLPNGDHAIVTEGEGIRHYYEDAYQPPTPEAFTASTLFMAEGFTPFLYRFWFENVLWFRMADGMTLTPGQSAYLQHYVINL